MKRNNDNGQLRKVIVHNIDDDDDDDADDADDVVDAYVDHDDNDIEHFVCRKKSKHWTRRKKRIGMQTRGSSVHPPLFLLQGRSSRSTGPTIAT
jgi:hypothetical protein